MGGWTGPGGGRIGRGLLHYTLTLGLPGSHWASQMGATFAHAALPTHKSLENQQGSYSPCGEQPVHQDNRLQAEERLRHTGEVPAPRTLQCKCQQRAGENKVSEEFKEEDGEEGKKPQARFTLIGGCLTRTAEGGCSPFRTHPLSESGGYSSPQSWLFDSFHSLGSPLNGLLIAGAETFDLHPAS